jgi:transglutaminase-like putative cysteine protease
VKQVNAHAWPEVYFPGIGWVEFEPTGNQDALRRPLGASTAASNNNPGPILPGLESDEGLDALREGRVDESGGQGVPAGFESPAARGLRISLWILAAAALVLLNVRYHWVQRLPVLLGESYRRSGAQAPAWVDRWARWNRVSPIERSFHAVNLGLRWLGRPQAAHATPVERAQTLQTLLPSASTPVEILLAEHQAALFSPRPGNPGRARRAALEILVKTAQARLRRLFEFFSGTPIDPDGHP